MFTFQDFMKETKLSEAITKTIGAHSSSKLYINAKTADAYDHQQNTTITNYTKWLYSENGNRAVDKMSSNQKLCSNFFNRLNTQRMAYSLGNGVTFDVDGVKEKLGVDFDTQLRSAGYYALIHGVCFIFMNMEHIHVIPVTEFAPLYDETTNALRAGVRFWQIDSTKPVMAVLYEEDGYTCLKKELGKEFEVAVEKTAYKVTVRQSASDVEPEVVAEENYNGVLPIVPLWGSRLKQSTIVGIQSQIDAFDLVRSGFANDLQDCSEIYWIVSGAGGATDSDLARFRDRLKLTHIASVVDQGETPVTPYTQEIPFQSRKEFLTEIRTGIYEDFGALDVHAVSAGATNDHIEAAYQPMDENADDFEYQIINTVQALLRLIGIEATPIFKRNRISNQKEQTDMVLAAADYLDDETVLKKLPFITPDEVTNIMEKKDAEAMERFADTNTFGEGDD